MKKEVSTAVLCIGLLAGSVEGQTEWTSGRPDGHAPIGVMGDHVHGEGEFMFSYRFMRMNMEGSRDGSTTIADQDIVDAGGDYGFMVTPTRMPMAMHMLGMMYAPSDRLTLMVMANYLDSSMDHLMRNGNTFTTESSGIGDVGVSGLVSLMNQGSTRLHFTAGITLPTGSIEETAVTPMSSPDAVQLPYAMQSGTGSVGLSPALTFLGMGESISYGAQATATFQAGENSRDYKVGNRFAGTAWLAVRPATNISFSARGKYTAVGNYSGADAALNPMMVPTARPDLRGGSRVDVPLGVNLWVSDGPMRGFRLLAEYDLPVWRDLDGPQLEVDGVFTVGVQWSFDPH